MTPTLFHRYDSVDASWRIVNPILDVWQALPARDFPNYAAGTWGPEAADQLIARTGHSWHHYQLTNQISEAPAPTDARKDQFQNRRTRNPRPTHILAGDIGGTKTNLAIFTVVADKLVMQRNHRYPSASYSSLNAIVREFLDADLARDGSVFRRAGAGQAGPRKADEPRRGAWMRRRPRRISRFPT